MDEHTELEPEPGVVSEHEPLYLGYMKSSTDDPPILETHPLRRLDDEGAKLAGDAIEYIAQLDGEILENGLPDSLTAIHELIDDVRSMSISAVMTPAFKLRVRRRFNEWFAEFTAFRAELELRSELDPANAPDEPKALFDRAYHNDAEYRLTYQMRHISQHKGSVWPYLRYQSWIDTSDESTHSRFWIKTGEMFAAYRGRKDWDECEALWTAKHGSTNEVDVVETFNSAYRTAFGILSHFVINRIPKYESTAKCLAGYGNEAGKHGYPVLYRMRVDRAARQIHGLDLTQIDPSKLRAAWVAMECARLYLFDDSARGPIPRLTTDPPDFTE
ncbi:hypothetical protein BH09ACT6_BH09ACT6_15410 [soil metagenome]